MSNCNCHACRTYFGDCGEPKHKRRVRAKHLNGHYYWGKDAKDMPGRWVVICVSCQNSLADYGND